MKKSKEQRVAQIDDQLRKIGLKILKLNYQSNELRQARERLLKAEPKEHKLSDPVKQSKKDKESYLLNLEDYLFETTSNQATVKVLDSMIRKDLEPLLLDERK